MPYICVARLLVVTSGLCSALAGKAIAVSLNNASLLTVTDPLILVVKQLSDPPMGDPNDQETLGQYLDTVPDVDWGQENSTSRAVQSIWQNGSNTYNIAMDPCAPKDAIVGIYQFANGTSKNDATIYDISQDLLEFAGWNSYPTRERRFAHQAVKNLQLAVNDINAFLSNNHTLCDSVSVSGSDRTELRRLLVDPDDLADGYWAAVILKGAASSLLMDIGIFVTGETIPFNATFSHYGLSTVLSFGLFIITGLVDRAQKTGKLNYLGALLGSAVPAFWRASLEEAGSTDVSLACDSDIESNRLSLSSYVTAVSEISLGQCTT